MVAIIQAKPSNNNYKRLFNDAFEFDLYSLTSNRDVKKVLKKDVDINIDIEAYDWIILVGAEPFKMYTKNSSITEYSGRIVNDKFLPTINPAMITFKPEAKKPWETSRDNIIKYISGEMQATRYSTENFIGIENPEEAIKYLQEALAHPNDFIALDSETSSLYCRNGYMMGFSLAYQEDSGAYILTDCIDDEVEALMQKLFNKKTVVFHNAKFDIVWFEYQFNFEFPNFEDTMLMHYALDETQGTHGLKALALRFTKYGGYEDAQTEWIEKYCKKNRIKKSEFTYDLIPFEIIKQYAALDAACTLALYIKFKYYLSKNSKLMSVYRNILIPGCRFLATIQENGVPFDITRLRFAQQSMEAEIRKAEEELTKFPEVALFEEKEGKQFNPNSTLQLRKLLFDYIGLRPTGKLTGTGAHSTDAEVLGKLAELHEVPKHILAIRKSGKIKNTYLDKIIPQLDMDGRLRTNFSLHTTTSGRLSSSGKLNLQQLPRDNPAVKGCIKARKGWKIVAMDLSAAEMYLAAIISEDLELQDIFRKGGDFHSQMAKKVFKLDCDASEVAELYPDKRQAVKAISFGILYGSGPSKVAETVTAAGTPMSTKQAQAIIKEYFTTFWMLKQWLDGAKEFILDKAYIYSPFGRKRRLPNVKSDNSGIQGHEIRSGINAVIQSAGSDVNLLGAIEMQAYIESSGMQAKIFALVHDSIIAEVLEEEIESYKEILVGFVQKDRGVSIPNTPIGCDFEVIADDYSNGKFMAKYEEAFNNWI